MSETLILKVTDDNLDSVVQKAAELLNAGEVVAIPTETVYGLAASIYNEEALKQVFTVKGRPQDNPVIVHISDLVMLADVTSEVNDDALKLAKRFWPGPLTMVLPKSDNVSGTITCNMSTVGVRMPSHFVAHAIIETAGVPLAIPSANLSGKPSTTNAQHVIDDLNGKIPLIVDAGPCDIGVESTVISLIGDVPTILRPGMISLEDIKEILPNAVVSDNVLKAVASDAKVESPGMKYKHYSPRAEVILVTGSLEKFVSYVEQKRGDGVYAMCFDGEEVSIPIPSVAYGAKDNAASQSQRLFSVLRALDKISAMTVYVRSPGENDRSLAVMNRLIRAAAFKVVDL